MSHKAPREAPGSVRRQKKQGENMAKSLCWDFHEKEETRHGEEA